MGAQLPFTSINEGLNTSFEGRKVTEWMLRASIDGIGKFKSTAIFPISIFCYKKDVNDRPGTPNYDLKKLAIKSLCLRVFPNWVNCDWSMNKPDLLPSQYKMGEEFYDNDYVDIRIGSQHYKKVSLEKLWDKLMNLQDKYKVYKTEDGREIIDLRFTEIIVCISDKNACYRDYALSTEEKMARLTYLTKSKQGKYGITTDTFEFDIYNEKFKLNHIRYEIPGYDYDTEMATMGCRTLIGLDVNGMGYKKTGRGNVSPITLNLVKLGIKNGICLGERKRPNTERFFKQLRSLLELAEKALLDRFRYICSQDYRSGYFWYMNGLAADTDKSMENGLFETMRHGTQAMGYIGLSETCFAMYGKYHNQDTHVKEFAKKVVKTIHDFAKEATERNSLNFSAYATPSENSCYTICKNLQKEFGKIPGVCDREYITNSHHIPVWEEVSIKDKIDIESEFTSYPTGGCITYVELESNVMGNEKAIEDIIDYAASKDIPYLAINFPSDTCEECGYRAEIEDTCPVCGSKNIKKLRRVTGYLSTDFRKFNKGKIEECNDRIKHSKYSKI